VDIKLIRSAPEGRAGCLTGGKHWDFVIDMPTIIAWEQIMSQLQSITSRFKLTYSTPGVAMIANENDKL
jgi:hypothetical protein